ncbi:MAG: hypothetical protein OEZ39_19715 [Gammaproteobacteria bacterium]|nr:hypothetical protein [Gammaproteobacteria bacterium]MDH5654095.1 hypothetical protein [Gammaproteobacteria bacterium]
MTNTVGKFIGLTGLWLLCVSPTAAADYGHQATIQLLDDSAGPTSIASFSISYTGYLSNVKTDTGPYLEAAFINPVSHFAVELNSSDASVTLGPAIVFSTESVIRKINYTHVNAGGDITFGLGIDQGDTTLTNNSIKVYDADSQTITLQFGLYFDKFSYLSFSLVQNKLSSPGGIASDYTTTSSDISWRQLQLTANQTATLWEFGVISTVKTYEDSSSNPNESTTHFQFSWSRFLDRKTGLGGALDYVISDEQDDEGLNLTLRGSYFVRDDILMALEYTQFLAGNTGVEDGTTTVLEMSARF